MLYLNQPQRGYLLPITLRLLRPTKNKYIKLVKNATDRIYIKSIILIIVILFMKSFI
jgi:hypothetical protein